MGQEELKAALRDKARRKIEAVWKQARVMEQTKAAELAEGLERRREHAVSEGKATGIPEARGLILLAERSARARLVAAKLRLAERLLALAVEMVARPDSFQMDPGALFSLLADELPPAKWRCLRVGPHDEARARQLFPETRIDVDEGIHGGLIAENGEGLIVVNTLEKRLARRWPELLPQLMRHLLDTAAQHDRTSC